MAFKFEELRVWEIAINLAADVSVLNKKFPVDERFVFIIPDSKSSGFRCFEYC